MKMFDGRLCGTKRAALQVRLWSLLGVAIGTVLLGAVAGSSVARADDLQLGASYTYPIYVDDANGTNQAVGGGSIAPSYLDGIKVPYVYCIDIYDDVGVPADYANATVTANAVVYYDGQGDPNNYAAGGIVGGVASPDQEGTVNNAAQVAYLLQTYVGTAITFDAQAALQAAIWSVIYSSGPTKVTVTAGDSNDATMYADYVTDMTNIGSGNIAAFNWLSPVTGGNGNTVDQALVSDLPSSPVPEPAGILMFGTILVGVSGLLRRKLV